MISMLRRWIAGLKNDENPSDSFTTRPRQTSSAPDTHSVTANDKAERQVEDRELALRYCATLFFRTDPCRQGRLTNQERDWLEDWQKRMANDNGSFSGSVPRLPVVMPKLMAALRDAEQVDLKHVAGLIESDPVLAANVLRVVNSAAIRGRAGDIDSLTHAVTRLGRNGLREVVFAAIVSPLADFGRDRRLNDEAVRRIWPQTLQAAVNVKMGAEHSGMSAQRFDLYLAALSHSTGLMVMLRELKRLEFTELSSEFLNEFERLARYASINVARGWDFGEQTLTLLTAWADGDLGRPEVSLLSRVIEFGRVHHLCQQGHLEPDFRDTYCRALPVAANEWVSSVD
ncbi:MAG: HDOD domain-containing protein [Guyparkeria sp.]